MCDGRLALELDLTDIRGPILHGDAGYIPWGSTRTSFYYSRPRMKAVGTLEIDGQARPVTGMLWFDRQWGYDVRDPWLMWDWFSLRLDDGSSIMLYVFRDPNSPLAEGTYVPAIGQPIHLDAAAFTVQSTDHWTSPHTAIRYPMGWDISIPSQGLTLAVTAAAKDQEFDALLTTFNIYWEGLCTVTGVRTVADQPGQSQPVTGFAYTELTNYTPAD
jgi:predicted secreted hydrolase